MGIVKMFVGGVFTLFVGSCVYLVATAPNKPQKPPPTPEEAAAQAAKEREYQQAVAGARWIKANMKNPASFELVFAGVSPAKVLCFQYRGTNSFNAVVPNYRVIGDKLNSGESAAWNRHCAGKTLTDYTYARWGL